MYADEADGTEEPRLKKKHKKTADATPSAFAAPADVPQAQGQQTVRKSNKQAQGSMHQSAPANQAAAAAAGTSHTAKAFAKLTPGGAAQQKDLDPVPASDDLVTPKKKRKKQRPLDHQSEPVRQPSAVKQSVHQKPVKSHPEDLAHHQSSSDRATMASARQQPSGAAPGVSSANANGSIRRKKDKKSSNKDGAPDLTGSKHKSKKKQHQTG